MTRDHDSRSKGSREAGDAGEPGTAEQITPQMHALQHRMRLAVAYNQAHPDQVEDFNRLTGGVATKGVRAIMAWQGEHGLKRDGKIGPETLSVAATAAQAQAGGQDNAGAGGGKGSGGQRGEEHGGAREKPPAGAPTRAASTTVTGEKSDGAAKAEEQAGDDGGDLAEEIVAGGVTASQAHRPKEKEDASAEGGRTVSEGVEHGLEGAPDLEGHELGVRGIAQIARIPHLVHLVREKKYEEALKYVSETLGFEDAVEVIKATMEYAGIELSNLEVVAEIALKFPKIAKVARTAAAGATAADIVLVGLEFQYEALKALAEAKEKGERDNTIYLYATAWANGFLNGTYSNPGAIDEKQKQAVADGLREGKQTAGNAGERAAEIAKKLMDKYGGDEKNIEKALVDALLKRAGIEGIRLHHQ